MDPGGNGEKRKLPANRLRLVLLAALFLAAVAVTAFFLWPKAAPLQAPAPSAELQAQARGLDTIRITASFDPGARQLAVVEELELTNRGEEPRDSLVLRTFANAFQSPDTSPAATEELYQKCYPQGFSAGSLVISSAQLHREGQEGVTADYRYTDEAKTVLRFPLDSPWEKGQTLVLELQYTLTIPKLAGRFGENSGFWALGNAFPLPAVSQDGAYREDPYYAVGDPFLSECMNFSVSLTLPKGYTAAGSAWPSVTPSSDGTSLYAFEALSVRDFALCLSNGYRLVQVMEDGVLVSTYAKDDRQAAQALGFARQALSCYNRIFGAYPYPAYTLAQVDFPFGGMEYPSLVMLGSDLLQQGGQDLELLVAHETAHQWWYGVVGSDQVNQAWQDEALCEYSLLPYVQQYHGIQAREDIRFSRIETAMRVTVPLGITPGSPLELFADGSEYATVVYGRGAAFLVALDTALGGGLDDFLKAYYDRYRFRLLTRQDFENELRAFSGQDWSALMTDYLDTFMIR
jgi:hypothetical protein